MSRVDELIAEHCPDGVKFEILDDIAGTVPGLSGKTKADFSDGNARFVSYMNAFKNIDVNQEALDFVAIKPGERQNRLHEGDVIITGSSESLEEVGMSSAVASEPVEPLYLNSFCFALRFNDPTRLLASFSKYLFRGESTRKQIRATASGVTRINISKGRFLKIRIPVPPLEVQREIVRILDKFTHLEAELEAELEARTTQYEETRNSLLSLDGDLTTHPWSELIRELCPDGVEHKPLGDCVLRNTGGGTPSRARAEYWGGSIRWASVGDITASSLSITDTRQTITEVGLGASSSNLIPAGHVVVAVKIVPGAMRVVQRDIAINQDLRGLLLRDDVDPYFLTYYFKTLNVVGHGTIVKGITKSTLEGIRVPVPPLPVQEEIVRILDSFDALVSDISIGLPAEIAARRKQYEYYRDKLLSFKELVA